MAGDKNISDAADQDGPGDAQDPLEPVEEVEPTAGAGVKTGLSGHARQARRRLEPLASRARAALTDENAQALARQARTFAQSEQAARAAKVVGGLVVSAIITKQMKPGGLAQGAAAAAARAAGLTDDATQRPPARSAFGMAAPATEDSPPAWQPPREASAGRAGRYPTEPGLLHLGFSGSGYHYTHPELPDLWVESEMHGWDAVVGFGWAPAGARRSHIRGPEVSDSWAPAECTGQILPLELRRVTDTDIEFRWLEPTRAQRSVKKLFQPPPVDPKVMAGRMKIALDAVNNKPRWRA